MLLDDSELVAVREAARDEGVPVSEWVRRRLREARASRPQGRLDHKLRAVREAARHEGPTGDIDQMLAEIERGYGAPAPE